MSVRRFAILCVVVFLGCAVGAALSSRMIGPAQADAPKAVKAERFELVDGSGRVRGALSVGGGGAASLTLLDPGGAVGVEVAQSNAGPSLTFYGAGSRNLVQLFAPPQGDVGLMISDQKGNLRAVLAANPNECGLSLADNQGLPRIKLGDLPAGDGLLISDEHQKARAVFSNAKTGPTLNLSDQAGQKRVQLAVPPTGPIVEFKDSDGKTTWKRPEEDG
jgi:hypothetical protein